MATINMGRIGAFSKWDELPVGTNCRFFCNLGRTFAWDESSRGTNCHPTDKNLSISEMTKFVLPQIPRSLSKSRVAVRFRGPSFKFGQSKTFSQDGKLLTR